MIFDSHTHYDSSRFDADREDLLSGFKEKGMRLVAVGADLGGSEAALKLAQSWPMVSAAIGVHPDAVGELEALGEPAAWEKLMGMAQRPQCVAVGEIGLDYYGDYPDKTPRPLQQKWFRIQMELLKERKLPGIIHSRDAAQDTLTMIREAGGADLPLVCHCFGYEVEMARKYLDMGHFLGIGGVVTFKNGRKLKEVVRYMPMEQLLIETDCPYLAPEPFRGQRCDSGMLPYVIDEIARIKELPPEEVERVSFENACRFFRLPQEAKA